MSKSLPAEELTPENNPVPRVFVMGKARGVAITDSAPLPSADAHAIDVGGVRQLFAFVHDEGALYELKSMLRSEGYHFHDERGRAYASSRILPTLRLLDLADDEILQLVTEKLLEEDAFDDDETRMKVANAILGAIEGNDGAREAWRSLLKTTLEERLKEAPEFAKRGEKRVSRTLNDLLSSPSDRPEREESSPRERGEPRRTGAQSNESISPAHRPLPLTIMEWRGTNDRSWLEQCIKDLLDLCEERRKEKERVRARDLAFVEEQAEEEKRRAKEYRERYDGDLLIDVHLLADIPGEPDFMLESTYRTIVEEERRRKRGGR